MYAWNLIQLFNFLEVLNILLTGDSPDSVQYNYVYSYLATYIAI